MDDQYYISMDFSRPLYTDNKCGGTMKTFTVSKTFEHLLWIKILNKFEQYIILIYHPEEMHFILNIVGERAIQGEENLKFG